MNALHSILHWCAQHPLGGAAFLLVGALITIGLYTLLHDYVLQRA